VAAPRVRLHLGGPASQPSSPGQFLDGPGPCPWWYSAQVSCRKVGFLHFFHLCISALRLLFAPFGMFSTCIQTCDLQNMFSRIQVELGQ
jgi:hypothetical protein